MSRALLLAAGLLAALGSTAAAQAPTERIRVMRPDIVGDSVTFGRPAELRIEIRGAPGTVLFLPDTLRTAAEMANAGRGRWARVAGAGDSLVVEAIYPVIGFRAGVQELPALEFGVGASASGSDVRPIAEVSNPDQLARLVVALGSTTITGAPAFGDSVPAIPRPPADVWGGEWSLWLILAVGFATLAGAGGIGAFLPRWWRGSGSDLVDRLRGKRPRQQALKALDRLRAEGLHREGRTDEFYARLVDIVRGYTGHLDHHWTSALTTRELLKPLAKRFGEASVEPLGAAFATAERARFADRAPDAVTADADWQAVRDWIAAGPDE